MRQPRLFADHKALESIRENLRKYPWYFKSYRRIKEYVDLVLEKGFEVPLESGFVFYETCPRDNTRLDFDPFLPGRQACPTCGVNYMDMPYRRARLSFYHAWLSQVGMLMGIVYQMEKDDSYALALKKILSGYAVNYRNYPNNDNELGPTRIFQSTFMESVWLTFLAGGYDLAGESPCFSPDEKKTIDSELFRASAEIILDYDEKMNNRQAFNNAGICAAGYLLDEKRYVDHALAGKHGFYTHMNESVLEDGLWYEGDNYHFATLPSMVNIAEMARHNGLDLYGRSFNGHTIKMMFDAPLQSLQPDLTFPSRKDSVYANHFAQKWYAGLYELAYQRYRDPAYARMLNTIYRPEYSKKGPPASSAGIMDVLKSSHSSREALDWRGFLTMFPDTGTEYGPPVTVSVNMKGTGLGVLRSNGGKTYAGLDYGAYGGGHGHPDRLNLNYFANGRRWLSDWGTGNYYLDHLKWYRSTLAHNTVGVDGRDQLPSDGHCLVFQETPEVSVVKAAVQGTAPGVGMRRTLMMFPGGVLLDIFDVLAEQEHAYRYALHSFGELDLRGPDLRPDSLEGEQTRFLEDIRGGDAAGDVHAMFQTEEACLHVRLLAGENTRAYQAKAYGPPNRIPEKFPVLILQRKGSAVRFLVLMEPVEQGSNSLVSSFEQAGDHLFLRYADGTVYEAESGPDGVRVIKNGTTILEEKDKKTKAREDGGLAARRGIHEGEQGHIKDTEGAYAKIPFIRHCRGQEALWGEPLFLLQDKSQVRRAEKHWEGPHDLSAAAWACHDGERFLLKVCVTDDHVLFGGGKFNFDNDSIQVYFDNRGELHRKAGSMQGTYGLMVLPGAYDNCARVQSIGEKIRGLEKIGVSVDETEEGYEVFLDIPWECVGGAPAAGERRGFDIIVNDRDRGVRRDLQMVWSGCPEDERIYLREDHHNPDRFGVVVFCGEEL